MRFKPRHYVLIVAILLLGAFNFYRSHKAGVAKQATPALPARSTDTTPQVVAAWSAYDRAAALRDAKPDDFHPALVALTDAQAALPASTPSNAAPDIDACRIWLLSYRDGTLSGPGGRNKAFQHIDRCVQLHRDASI